MSTAEFFLIYLKLDLEQFLANGVQFIAMEQTLRTPTQYANFPGKPKNLVIQQKAVPTYQSILSNTDHVYPVHETNYWWLSWVLRPTRYG